MTDDTNDAVFGQRAGGPALTSLGFEPAVRGLMTHVSRINEGDQDVDIKQECHSHSSRSAFTVSSVTTAPSSLRGSSGIPFCVLEDCGRCRARRARSDT